MRKYRYNARYMMHARLLLVGILTATLAALALLVFDSTWLGTIVAVAYLVFHAQEVGRLLSVSSRAFGFFLGLLALLIGISTVLSIGYWVFGYSEELLAIVLYAVPLVLWGLHHTVPHIAYARIRYQFERADIALAGLFGAYAMLLVRLLMKRTGDSLSSPWILTGWLFFLIACAVFVGTLLYVRRANLSPGRTLLLAVPHYALLFTVFLLVVKHGYGFDPFIHQAAERVILQDGVILPKQPYYIGQYMLTLLLHGLTNLPLHLVDTALVPVFAALFLPVSLLAYAAKHKNVSSAAVFLLGYIPLPFFTVTTPHNLALLLALLSFTLWRAQIRPLAVILAVGALVTHPLVGIPLGVFLGGLYMHTKGTLRKTELVGTTVTLFLIIPVLLYLNGLRTAASLVLQNPLDGAGTVLSLFRIPDWYLLHQAPFLWQQLYLYKLALLPIMILVLLGTGVSFAYKERRSETLHTMVFLCAIAASGILLGTTLRFPNVISYEQGGYAYRLLTLSFILLLPYGLVSLSRGVEWMRGRHAAATVGIAVLLFGSWYFTYPTRDPVSWYNGYGVRDADIEAVQFIADRNADTHYVVITNQSVAAAALKEFGFFEYHNTDAGPQFIYSIPTGGPLYTFFGKMVYQEPKRQWMLEAMDFSEVDRAYFVHTNYWAPAAKIRDDAKKEADQWWELGGGRVWVYEYTR